MKRSTLLVGVVAALVALAGCGSSSSDPDSAFQIRLAGHYGAVIDPDAKQAVIQHAHEACDQLQSGKFTFGDDVAVLIVEGKVDKSTAEAIVRSAVDVYCPSQQAAVPPAA